MNKDKVSFIVSASAYSNLPPPRGDEFAILGRSNVGKSSLINHLFADRSLARTSKTPGRTALANFFQVQEKIVFVDLPGYGYAKVSGSERLKWDKLIGDYCKMRQNLKGVLWLLDSRHPGQKADYEALEWLGSLSIPMLVILTKCDKLTKNVQNQNSFEYKNLFKLQQDPILYSIQDNSSRERFWSGFKHWTAYLDQMKVQG